MKLYLSKKGIIWDAAFSCLVPLFYISGTEISKYVIIYTII